MNKEELFRIGIITEPHGIRGEVKVFPTTDDPDRIKKLKEIYLATGSGVEIVHPVSVKWQKQFIILKFDEFEDRNAVEGLRRRELYVDREHAVKLDKDEYYVSDLIGLKCIDEDEKVFGILDDVLQTGANDVYQIIKEDGNMLLIPAIKECILEVNIEKEYVKIHVLEGL